MAATVYIGDTDTEALDRYRKANDALVAQLTKLWHDHDDHRVDAQLTPTRGSAAARPSSDRRKPSAISCWSRSSARISTTSR